MADATRVGIDDDLEDETLAHEGRDDAIEKGGRQPRKLDRVVGGAAHTAATETSTCSLRLRGTAGTTLRRAPGPTGPPPAAAVAPLQLPLVELPCRRKGRCSEARAGRHSAEREGDVARARRWLLQPVEITHSRSSCSRLPVFEKET